MPAGGSRPLHQTQTLEYLLISLDSANYCRAILAADVIAHNRLMEQDEAGTLAALKAFRSERFGRLKQAMDDLNDALRGLSG